MEMDPIWQNFGVPHDFESYCQESIPVIYLKDDVHNDVHEEFRAVNKLIRHSFFEYKFYDVAILKAVLALELALSIRYEEVNHEKAPQEFSLTNYLEWFHKRRYFEIYNNKFLEYFIVRRNELAHLKKHSFMGPMNRDTLLYCGDLINDLYENPDLRKERMNLMLRMERRTRKLVGNGLKVIYEDGRSDLVFMARPCFINNKVDPPIITYIFKPLIKFPKTINAGEVYPSPLHYLTANYVEYTADSISFTDFDNNKIHFLKIEHESDKRIFESWCVQYNQYNFLARESGIINLESIQFFSENLRKFHFYKSTK